MQISILSAIRTSLTFPSILFCPYYYLRVEMTKNPIIDAVTRPSCFTPRQRTQKCVKFTTAKREIFSLVRILQAKSGHFIHGKRRSSSGHKNLGGWAEEKDWVSSLFLAKWRESTKRSLKGISLHHCLRTDGRPSDFSFLRQVEIKINWGHPIVLREASGWRSFTRVHITPREKGGIGICWS